MIKFIKSLFSCFLILLIVGIPVVVNAQSPNELVDCTGAADSAFCEGRKVSGNPLFGWDGVLTKAAQILTVVTGIISIYIITLAGFRFIRSGGDPQKVEAARNALLYAAIGVVITISAQAIISLVLNKL